MQWAIVALAISALTLVTTFVSLYVAALKREHSAKQENVKLDLAVTGANNVIRALRKQETRLDSQIEVLRNHLAEAEDALRFIDNTADLRNRIDGLLSSEVQEDDQGSNGGD